MNVSSPLLRASRERRSIALLALALGTGCAARPVSLTTPALFPSMQAPKVAVELAPLAPPEESSQVTSAWRMEGPLPEQALGRAMHDALATSVTVTSTEPLAATCRLDRFAIRSDAEEAYTLAILYADVRCEVVRRRDHALVFRGELRGRSCAAAHDDEFASTSELRQALADRLVADGARELVADLLVGGLGIPARPSLRSFPSERNQRDTMSVDDGPLGLVALSADPVAAREALPDLRAPDARARAAAWNALAMAASPEAPWLAGIDTRLDDDAFVRFFQYKALLRHATVATLSEAKRALKRENQPLLEEMLRDGLRSGGLAFDRAKLASAASADTNGTTTSP